MDATLKRQFSEFFDSTTISLGIKYHQAGLLKVQEIGRGGIVGLVPDGHGVTTAGLDFSDLDDDDLGVDCDCQHFNDGGLCEHLFSLIAESIVRGVHFPDQRSLRFYACEWTEIDIGPALGKPRVTHQGQRTVAWKRQLQSVSSLQTQLVAETPSSRLHEEVRNESQIWFAISLADVVGEQELVIKTFQSTRKKDRQWSKPKSASFLTHEMESMSDAGDREALALLEPVSSHGPYHNPRYSPTNQFQLRDQLVAPAMKAMAATGRLYWTMDAGRQVVDPHPVRWDDGPEYRLQVSIQPHLGDDGKERFRVQPNLIREGESIAIKHVMVATDEGVLLLPDRACLLRPDQAAAVRGWQETESIDVPKTSFATLMDEVAKWSRIELDLHPNLPLTIQTGIPSPRLHLVSPGGEAGQNAGQGGDSGVLDADVLMVYGDQPINVSSGEFQMWDRKEKTLLRRDLKLESELMRPLRQEDFRMDSFGQLQMPRKRLPDVVPQLNELGWEVVADGNAIRRASSFDISVTSGQDWFDLNASANFGSLSVMLPELLAAAQKGKNYVVLDDGSHGLLPNEWLSKFTNLNKTGDATDDSIRFTKSQALLLDAMLGEQEDVSLDRQFKAWCKKLNSFTGIKPVEAPKGFEGELREYQQLGLGWFRFLQDFHLGGCLADDMGLGKTIQVLALLLQRQKRRRKPGESRKPSLIVVPKSLVFNWIEEAEKFAPGLDVLNYTGTQRSELREHLTHCDAIVTTYGTLRNDIAFLREEAFDYVILDEAQAIKNPKSQAAKASRLVNGEHRLAMTGTPVENHLGDLWSIFDFLNPGMLGQTLGTANAGPSTDNEQRIRHVAKSLRPFILRRTKEQVLTELPEKTEQTLYCDMEPKQRKMYVELRDHYRARLTKKIKEDGLAKSKIQVLEALLRLRQAACDPRLIAKDSKVVGAKILRLVDQLGEVISEGHKALVFSQFTSLLSLVRKEIDDRGWDYEYLDGKTTKRSKHVERFQTDPNCPLFLISLKAGGSGLNLTAADYVFILDPWWNPAVEAQAIDRAHRMGQTKSVMAYRMICRDTVEEKIVEMQSSKRKLADAIISQERSMVSDLSSDDLRMLFS